MPSDSGGMEQRAEIRIPRRWLSGAKRISQTSGTQICLSFNRLVTHRSRSAATQLLLPIYTKGTSDAPVGMRYHQ